MPSEEWKTPALTAYTQQVPIGTPLSLPSLDGWAKEYKLVNVVRFLTFPFICKLYWEGGRAVRLPPFCFEVYHAKGHQQILAGVRAFLRTTSRSSSVYLPLLGAFSSSFQRASPWSKHLNSLWASRTGFRVPGFHLPARFSALRQRLNCGLHRAHQCLRAFAIAIVLTGGIKGTTDIFRTAPFYAPPSAASRCWATSGDPLNGVLATCKKPAGAGCQGRFQSVWLVEMLAVTAADDHLRGLVCRACLGDPTRLPQD